jgi:transcriptional regulator with XRE-family HTH domain
MEDNRNADSAARVWLRWVGERVRLQRLNAELTQEQLGAAAGISREFIGLIEMGGDASAFKLWRLADTLQIPLVRLLTDEAGDR